MNRRDLLALTGGGALVNLSGCLDRIQASNPDYEDEDDSKAPGCTQKEEWPGNITSGPADPDVMSIAGRRDCEEAERPEPTGDVCTDHELEYENSTQTVSSAGVKPYPDPPTTLDEETIPTFVYEYERAYTRNSWVESYREDLLSAEALIQEDATRFLDREDTITGIRIQFTVSSDDVISGGHAAGSDVEVAVYGVDETGIVRTEAEPHYGEIDETVLEDTPDPVEDGELLECF